MIQNKTPQSAYQFLLHHTDAVLIDVRTTEEHRFVGVPSIQNIALIPIKYSLQFIVNHEFIDQVTQHIKKNDKDAFETPLLLLCRSGVRSLFAGEILLQAGFKQVYNVEGGFEGDLNASNQRSGINGWKFDNLPWKQS